MVRSHKEMWIILPYQIQNTRNGRTKEDFLVHVNNRSIPVSCMCEWVGHVIFVRDVSYSIFMGTNYGEICLSEFYSRYLCYPLEILCDTLMSLACLSFRSSKFKLVRFCDIFFCLALLNDSKLLSSIIISAGSLIILLILTISSVQQMSVYLYLFLENCV